MRTKVRITHFAVLGCVYSYSVESPGVDAINGKITLSELDALVDKVMRSEPVTVVQGLLVVLHQVHFTGLYSNLVHKHAMLDDSNNYLYVDGDRICTETTGYGFLIRDSQVEDIVTAAEALAEQQAEDAKHYRKLRDIMAARGWSQLPNGTWSSPVAPVDDQSTMFDAIVAVIVKGSAK